MAKAIPPCKYCKGRVYGKASRGAKCRRDFSAGNIYAVGKKCGAQRGELAARQLLCRHTNNVDLRQLNVPVAWDRLEDETELTIVAWLEMIGGDGLGVDVRLPRTNERDGKSFDGGGHAFIVAAEDLNRSGGYDLRPDVVDVAVDKCGLPAGEAGGLAHGNASQDEVAGVGIEWENRVRVIVPMVVTGEKKTAEDCEHDETGYEPDCDR